MYTTMYDTHAHILKLEINRRILHTRLMKRLMKLVCRCACLSYMVVIILKHTSYTPIYNTHTHAHIRHTLDKSSICHTHTRTHLTHMLHTHLRQTHIRNPWMAHGMAYGTAYGGTCNGMWDARWVADAGGIAETRRHVTV